MFNTKTLNLGTALAGVTLATVSFAAAPAQAFQLTSGSISLSGTSGITNTSSGNRVEFRTTNIDSKLGSLASVVQPPNIAIQTLNLTTVVPGTLDGPSTTAWIDFGTQTIQGVTSNLTFNLDTTVFNRIPASGAGQVFIFANPGITGKFVFNGVETNATGFVSASRSLGSSSYQVSLQVVPEPITMLGVGTAVGFGAFFKRQASRKPEKDKNNA